tara:strand:+ start:62 stop:691 length:630 start_codon:yes stop_codon:yes gene_type:complete
MNPKYQILKLKNGEELITTISKKENELFFVKIPMSFKTLIVPDPYSGSEKQITVLREWISYSTEDEFTIPANYILTCLTAEKDAVELYEAELSRRESDNKKRVIKKQETPKKDIQKDIQKELEDLLDERPTDSPFPPKGLFGMIPMGEDFIREMLKNIEDLRDGDSIDFEIGWSIPPEEINSNESTEEELNHPDFGNRWTDWSSNPGEY